MLRHFTKNKNILLALCYCCFLLLAGCQQARREIMSGHDEFEWLPNALLLEQEGETFIVGIKRHGEAYFYTEGHGSATKAMESSYYILCYDAKNMAQVAETKIEFTDKAKIAPPRVLGKDVGNIWIMTDQLNAYHYATLNLSVNKEKIEEKNPVLKNLLPKEDKYYSWDAKRHLIYITALDGSTWQLNTRNLEALPYAATQGDKRSKNKLIRQDKDWRNAADKAYKVNQDTLAASFYGLYSQEELSVYAHTFRNDPASSLDALRSLWMTPYKEDDNKITLDVHAMQSLGDKKFLNGFFLLDRSTGSAFNGDHPLSFIVAHKNVIGNNGRILLSGIAKDGSELWRVPTPIKEIKGLDFSKHYLLIQGTDDDQNNLIHKIYSIRLTDGKLSETAM